MTRRGSHHDTGLMGEQIAAEYLEKKGYGILNRRYRCRNGEIDLVAGHGTCIVFVEVKTVHSRPGEDVAFGEPEERIPARKQEALRRCAEHYLWKYEITDRDCRFDLITVRLSDAEPEIGHLENIL